jgi:hypothetical protein
LKRESVLNLDKQALEFFWKVLPGLEMFWSLFSCGTESNSTPRTGSGEAQLGLFTLARGRKLSQSRLEKRAKQNKTKNKGIHKWTLTVVVFRGSAVAWILSVPQSQGPHFYGTGRWWSL